MNNILALWADDAAAVLLSYLLGSVPTGLWLGMWLRGVDIREQGSKNIGATNTMRVLGKTLGALALAGDAGKGLISVLLFSRIGNWQYLPLACGLAAIFGHLFPLYLKFKGGKGVATGAGVFFALAPLPTLAALGVFIAVVAVGRMVSLGSLCAAATLTLLVWILPQHSLPLQVLTTLVAVFVFWKHRANIQRILQGTENRI
jgi:glycerol-3-phosphate acyltransferase PlsY